MGKNAVLTDILLSRARRTDVKHENFNKYRMIEEERSVFWEA
jgi:hypothetical protein